MPEMQYDMVRAGMIIFGDYPSLEVNTKLLDLQPALACKARVSYVKEVPAGTPISYGCRFVTERPSIIASLPLGYGDGYSRAFSKCGGEVLLRGVRVPIVGTICMDQLMVDVTDIGGAEIGERAVIIGKQGKEEITTRELADKIDTIPYEIICMLSERIPRRYIEY